MILKRSLIVFLFFLTFHTVSAQDFPTDYFAPPMKHAVSLSGTFAEIRRNHFHSGVDLRTGGKVGSAVHATADGYVSRVAISPWGGGKVLYVTHPNGYKTVYMHLHDFCGPVAKWVRNCQYSIRSFAIDTTLPANLIPVKKGEQIALSGNTGSSGGPHLHYEIRYAENDQPINPFYFGLPFTDNIKPNIRGIRIYPGSEQSTVNGSRDVFKLQRDTVWTHGPFYLGIYATDVSESSTGKNGVDRIELYLDGEPYWRYRVPSFRFDETRVMNSIIDYPLYDQTREYYIITRKLEGNHTDFSLDRNRGNGMLNLQGTHKLEYKVYDFKGNCSSRTFTVIATYAEEGPNYTDPADDNNPFFIRYNAPYEYKSNGFELSIPSHSLYCNDVLTFKKNADDRYFSPIYMFNTTRNPLPPHKTCTIRLHDDSSLPQENRRELVVVQIDGNRVSTCPTKRDGDWLVAKTRSFGNFAIARDNEPPKITRRAKNPVGILAFKVTDNLSGLQNYSVYINNKWVLAEYDGKTAMLSVNYKREGVSYVPGTPLRVVAEDACGNVAEMNY